EFPDKIACLASTNRRYFQPLVNMALEALDFPDKIACRMATNRRSNRDFSNVGLRSHLASEPNLPVLRALPPPCYGRIASLLWSCSARTANFAQHLVIQMDSPSKPVRRPPILPGFCLLPGSIRENQGAKPLSFPGARPRREGLRRGRGEGFTA